MFGLTPYQRNTAMRPMHRMDPFEREFFGDAFPAFFDGMQPAEFKTDISDRGDAFLLEADLPGFAKEDIHVDLNGDDLIITAERHSEHEDKDKQGSYIRCERSYGKYSRAFGVADIDTENIKAKYENGVLSLTLPKKEKTLPGQRRLEIE